MRRLKVLFLEKRNRSEFTILCFRLTGFFPNRSGEYTKAQRLSSPGSKDSPCRKAAKDDFRILPPVDLQATAQFLKSESI